MNERAPGLVHGGVRWAALLVVGLVACRGATPPAPTGALGETEARCTALLTDSLRARAEDAAATAKVQDAAYAEQLVAALRSQSPEAQHLALDRFRLFPDLLPARPDALEAVAAFLSDGTVAYSRACRATLAGNATADGIRFEQSRCMRAEHDTYGVVAATILHERGRFDSLAVDQVLTARVLATPDAAETAAPFVTRAQPALEMLPRARTDAQRLALLRLVIEKPDATGRSLAPVVPLLASPAVRVRAAFVVLNRGVEPAEPGLGERARAVLRAALTDDHDATVEPDFARWSSFAPLLGRDVLARFRRAPSVSLLRALGSVGLVEGEASVLGSILRRPDRADLHQPALRVLALLGRNADSARPTAFGLLWRHADYLDEVLELVAGTGGTASTAENAMLRTAYETRCAPRGNRHVPFVELELTDDIERGPPRRSCTELAALLAAVTLPAAHGAPD